MAREIRFHIPTIGREERRAVSRVMRSRWLTMGKETIAFESEFASTVNSNYACATNSCTSALHLALEALGIGPGDEVIVPTYTFTATAEVVSYLGATPVFVDVLPSSLQIDPNDFQSKVTEHTKAVIPVHFAGQPCDISEVTRIAEMHRLKIVWDAAHSFPAEYQGEMIGSQRDVVCFSFYANKTLSTAEGGMACTNDPQIDQRMRTMRLHGLDSDAWERFAPGAHKAYDVIAPGYKYNPTDLSSAIGRVQLSHAKRDHLSRIRIADQYNSYFENCLSVQPLSRHQDRLSSWHLFVVRLSNVKDSTDRNLLIQQLNQRKISVSVHYRPLHQMSHWKLKYNLQDGDFPVASAEALRVISLPIYPSLRKRDIERVARAVIELAEGNKNV